MNFFVLILTSAAFLLLVAQVTVQNVSAPVPTVSSMLESLVQPQTSNLSSCLSDDPPAVLAMLGCPITQNGGNRTASSTSQISTSCLPDDPPAVLAMLSCPMTQQARNHTTPSTPQTSNLNSCLPGDPPAVLAMLGCPITQQTAKHASSTAPPLAALTSTDLPIVLSNHSSKSAGQLVPKRTAEPRYRGFNVVNQSPVAPTKPKNTTEWADAFHHIRSFSGDYNAARLYSTTDGATKHLPNALPAAKSENISLFVGVWSGGDAHQDRFAAEKAALDEALAQFGCDNIIAVSVGNEDMYSNHRTDNGRTPLTDIMLLVNQTQEIMDVLDEHGCCDVKVTHTDTFGDWLQTNISEPLIQQVDFLTVNIFPYWEGQHIDKAGQTFWQHVSETRQMAAEYGKDIWIGETGWPMRGDTVGNAGTSPTLMHMYWDQIGCDLMSNMSAFWYVEWDANTIPSFGMMDSDGRLMINIHGCS